MSSEEMSVCKGLFISGSSVGTKALNGKKTYDINSFFTEIISKGSTCPENS